MIRFYEILMIALFGISFTTSEGSGSQTCQHTKTSFSCVRYIRNYDGDTITFKIPNSHPLIGESIPVRIRGVDSPEIKTKKPCEKRKAVKAKKFVSKLLSTSRRIDLHNVKRGKYFRIVADVTIDGASMRELLLSNGLAHIYSGNKKEAIDWCLK